MPYLYYICAGILVLVILVIIVVLIHSHTGKNRKIDLSYQSGNGQVLVHGKRKEYVISIGDEYEFLVQNGQIISARCKNQEEKIVSYSGGDRS